MEPVAQIRDSKGVAFLTRDEIDTDSRKEKAERHHGPGPYPRTFADIGGERQPEDNERGFLDRAEGKGGRGKGRPEKGDRERSEEHTSELQSLMRISYAVFCLKKKTTAKHKRQRQAIH